MYMQEAHYKSNYDRLICDIQRKPLVLFLGSGIYANLLPTWNELLGSLLDMALYKEPSYFESSLADRKNIINLLHDKNRFTLYEQATLVKYLLGNQYVPVLQDAIYRDFNMKYPQGVDPGEFALLNAILRLCKNNRVHAAVTYNYDTLLEQTINSKAGRKAYSVRGTLQRNIGPEEALPIYHVHGIIPNDHRVPQEAESLIVLSLDEYFHNMIEPYSWQTTSQLHFMQNYTCLYVGISLGDINMQRLLGFAKRYIQYNSIYIMRSEESFETQKADASLPRKTKEFIFRSHASIADSLGVHMIITGEKHGTVPEKLTQLLKELDKPHKTKDD